LFFTPDRDKVDLVNMMGSTRDFDGVFDADFDGDFNGGY
jgi:hypothetical protein